MQEVFENGNDSISASRQYFIARLYCLSTYL